MSNYTIGVDFGTESGRAILVDVSNGHEIATAVYPYANGVIDEKLPDSDIQLEPDWALQDPNDYLEVFKNAIPTVMKESGINPTDVIGLGLDFTACTMLKRMLFRYQGHISAALVLGGADATGPHVYQIYPHGSTGK